MLRIYLLIVLTLGVGLAQAKPSSSPHSKIYQINLIVFKNRGSANLNSQIWAAHPRQPNIANTIELASMGESPYWKALPNSVFALLAPLARLQTGGYQVITYLAWKQPIGSAHSTKAVRITTGNNQILDGTIKLSLTNYIVLTADLLLTEPVSTLDTNAQNGNPSQNLLSFPLNQTIRMRLGEIHYLDNPMYGILVLVNRA